MHRGIEFPVGRFKEQSDGTDILFHLTHAFKHRGRRAAENAKKQKSLLCGLSVSACIAFIFGVGQALA